MRLVAQLLGSIIVLVSTALIYFYGARMMYGLSWREEVVVFEKARDIEGNTTDLVEKYAANMDRVHSMANLSTDETRHMVQEYADQVLPNASVLVTAPTGYKEQWNVQNALGALVEGSFLTDNDLVAFPTTTSMAFCTMVSMAGAASAALICVSMISTYLKVLSKLLYYFLPMYNSENFNTKKYHHAAMSREAILFGCSVLYALAILALVCVMGYLESDKRWGIGESVFWGTLLFTGVGHSTVKPIYMQDIPQMSLWLSLCHYCLCLQSSAAIGLVIFSALRCFNASSLPESVPLSEDEIEHAVKFDHDRFTANEITRPKYHY